MLIDDLNYDAYLGLINIFSDVSTLFKCTKDIEKFKNIIYSKKNFIPKKVYSKLILKELKDNLDKIYINLKNQNIKIIPIISKEYPKNLLNIYNPPLVIFTYGDIKFNDKKIIYVYDENLSKFGKKVYKYFNYYMKNKMLIIGDSKECNFLVKRENIFDENYINNLENPSILVLNDNIKLEIILGIIDYLLIIEAKYNKDTKEMVCNVLENGKEILVVPGNIFNKNHYFSNYLIQEGATVLLNKYDLDKFI